MRIMAGRLKGRVLRIPAEAGCRPMLGVARKALFDIIRPRIGPASSFLDLFGGTGGVGIEAWSRGVDDVTINEIDRGRNRCIGENLAALGIAETVKLFRLDFREMLDYAARHGLSFDLVFTAPPYAETEYYGAVLAFFRSHPACLRTDGLLILEHHMKFKPDTAGFAVTKESRYGETVLLFLSLPQPAASEGRT